MPALAGVEWRLGGYAGGGLRSEDGCGCGGDVPSCAGSETLVADLSGEEGGCCSAEGGHGRGFLVCDLVRRFLDWGQ